MNDIFFKISEMIKEKKTNQIEVANNLATTQSNLSAILSGKSKPGNTLTKLANIIYGEERAPHKIPKVEKTIQLIESLNECGLDRIFDSAEREKQLEELMKEKENKEAA